MNKPEHPATVPMLKRREEEIDFSVYWAAIAERKWFITLIILLVLGVAVFYTLVATPVYQTDAMLQLETQKSATSGLDDLSQLLLGENGKALAELEIIRSRQILGKVVEKLKLDISAKPHYFPIIGAAFVRYYKKSAGDNTDKPMEPLWELSQFAWGGEKIEIASLTVSPIYENQALKLIAGENNRYQLYDAEDNLLLKGTVGKRAVAKARLKKVVEIVVAELQARPGTEFIVTKQSHSLTVLKLQEQLKASEKSMKTGILQLSLEGSEPDKITKILNTIAQVYVQQNIERKLQEVGNMLAFVNSQLPTIKANLEAAEAKLRTHYKKYGTVNVELETRTLLSQLAELEKRISSLELVEVQYKRQYTRENPHLIAFEKQLNQLKNERTLFTKRISQLPKAEMNLVKVMRDVEIAREVYSLLLNKAQEFKIAKAGITGNVYIVDPAIIPTEKIKPKKRLIIGAALILGLFFGVFIALLRKAMQVGIDSADIIEQRLNLPVYAIVPHSEKQIKLAKRRKKVAAKPQVLALEDPGELAIEGLRSLRTNLQFALIGTQRPIITITGPTPNIGKSFISVNLAYIMANTDKRVFLIDGDMRKGHLHQFLGREISPGLSEVISGECELEAAIHHISDNTGDKEISISFLSGGTRPPNPSELLMHERFQNLLETVSKQFDIIIIDTPPTIGMTDATIIGRLAGDTNFMVVRAEQQMLEEVELSLKLFEKASAKITGVIFNDVSPRSGYGYSNYYKYGYS
ncbi:MAG: polysaccharide biosynthesis tyrosine autokinase [Pseudomonadota bacterium]